MRAAWAYLFTLLLGSLWAAAPVHAATKHQLHATRVILTSATPGIEQQGHHQHCDLAENAEAITAVFDQQPVHGPVLLNRLPRFPARLYPVSVALQARREKARLYTYEQLILFPFHVFW